MDRPKALLRCLSCYIGSTRGQIGLRALSLLGFAPCEHPPPRLTLRTEGQAWPEAASEPQAGRGVCSCQGSTSW